MLSRHMQLFGLVNDGYWKDVGNVEEYHLAHQDFFSGHLSLDIKLPRSKRGKATIYLGPNAKMADDVKCEGTVVLGDNARVESGGHLQNCIIGDSVRIGHDCAITNTIIWPNAKVGDHSSLTGAIVGYRAEIGMKVVVLDNAIISDDCTIGDSATIKADCKIWPSKTVDDGAIVSRSMVWGDKWNRELFTESKVTGLALTELSPEVAVRIGSAFGASLGRGSYVVTSRDGSDISRLLRRALMSGLLSAGVNVSDLETMPVPVMRFCLQKGRYAAGVYVRHNPEDFRQIDIIVFDGSGLDMPTNKLKKIERNYFGEDYERARLDEIGHLDTPQRVLDDYRSEFLAEIDIPLLRKTGFNIVIDHSNGSSSQIFPTLFTELGVTATEINATIDPRKFSTTAEANAKAMARLSAIVSSLKADVGFILNSAAEKLSVVDELGNAIDGQLLLLLVTELFLQNHRPRRIAVPVGASMGVEEIAQRHGVEVVRVANDHRAMMEAHLKGTAEFVGGTRGGFIFPGFQMGADAILGTVRILEMMAKSNVRLSSLRHQFEDLKRESTSVPCPWAKKGTVMRKLITDSSSKQRQLIDGVRVFEDGGWVLVAPDRLKAAFNILAESRSTEKVGILVDQYRQLVEQSQKA